MRRVSFCYIIGGTALVGGAAARSGIDLHRAGDFYHCAADGALPSAQHLSITSTFSTFHCAATAEEKTVRFTRTLDKVLDHSAPTNPPSRTPTKNILSSHLTAIPAHTVLPPRRANRSLLTSPDSLAPSRPESKTLAHYPGFPRVRGLGKPRRLFRPCPYPACWPRRGAAVGTEPCLEPFHCWREGWKRRSGGMFNVGMLVSMVHAGRSIRDVRTIHGGGGHIHIHGGSGPPMQQRKAGWRGRLD